MDMKFLELSKEDIDVLYNEDFSDEDDESSYYKQCESCEEFGHIDEMIQDGDDWYHVDCAAAFGLIECRGCGEKYNYKEIGRICPECGEEWVDNPGQKL